MRLICLLIRQHYSQFSGSVNRLVWIKIKIKIRIWTKIDLNIRIGILFGYRA